MEVMTLETEACFVRCGRRCGTITLTQRTLLLPVPCSMAGTTTTAAAAAGSMAADVSRAADERPLPRPKMSAPRTVEPLPKHAVVLGKNADSNDDEDDRLLGFHERKLAASRRMVDKGKRKAKETKAEKKAKGSPSVFAVELHEHLFNASIAIPLDAITNADVTNEPIDELAATVDDPCAAADETTPPPCALAADDDPDYDVRTDGLGEEADASWIYELAESWEWTVGNQKHDGAYVRSRQDKKKPRRTRRYVNARSHKRAEEQRTYMQYHFQLRKDNARVHFAQHLSLASYSQSFQAPAGSSSAAPRNQPRGAHLNVLPTNVRDALMALQFKTDLTPEDYELLLRLDETVKPKTVSRHHVNLFPKLTATADDVATGKLCMVCMDAYRVGAELRRLPGCGHEFHVACIDSWLLKSSDRCPLDNLVVSL